MTALAQQALTEHTFSADGLEIHYGVAGSGPPMVLVHGWGSDARGNWVETGWVDTLAPLRRVIALDVRGHGASAKPVASERYSYSAMARDVLNLLDALGIERADFLGYSMGAFMGAWLLGHHPERFRTMVLGGVGAETQASIAAMHPIAAALRAPAAVDVTDPIGRAVRAFVDANPRIDATGREALALSALRMWPEGDALALAGPTLGSVQVPVLAVVGSEDVPYAGTVGPFVDAIPRGRLCALPGADHLSAVPMAAFKDAVLEFLAEHS